jgi:AcrR family transcriptional regulator
MNDIASAAKRGRRTIYMYFQNKEEIFSGVIENESKRIIALLKEVTDNKNYNALQKITEFSNLRMNLILDLLENRVALKNTYQQNFNIIDKVRVILDKGEIELLASIVEQGKNEGLFEDNSSIKIASYIHLIYKSFEFDIIKRRLNDSTNQTNDMTKIIINGIMKS